MRCSELGDASDDPCVDLEQGAVGLYEFAQIGPAARREEGLPEVADLRDPIAHVVDAEVFDAHTAAHLGPFERGGYARDGGRAHRVDAGERAAPAVLVVVDEDTPFRPLLLAVLRGHERRMA